MPNLTNYPNIRPSLLLDFSNSGRVDPRIEFTRATTATRVNSKGLIELVPAGVPRINYDLVTRECLGLLIEETRTNLATNSGNAALWGFSGAATGGQASTLGGNSATALKGPAAGPPTRNLVINGTSVTYQIAVKQLGAATTAAFLVRNSTTATNFNGGVIDFITGAASGFGWSARPASGGFFILTYTQSTGITSGDTLTFYYGVTGSAPASFELIVDWMQIEVGAFPSSYIPTAASSVTRAADLAQMTGSSFIEWHRPEGGTMLAEYRVGESVATQCVFDISDGTTTNRTNLYADNTLAAPVTPGLVVTVGGVGQVSSAHANSAPNTAHKIAAALSINDFAVVLDAGAVSTDSVGTLPVVSKATFGGDGTGASKLNGHVRRIAYYPARLTNAQLQALTAP